MKKIGIIRCMQTEDICPGTTDFSFAAQGKGAFEELGPCEVIGFVSCGGCPGKRAVARAGCWWIAAPKPLPWPPASARATPSASPARTTRP